MSGAEQWILWVGVLSTIGGAVSGATVLWVVARRMRNWWVEERWRFMRDRRMARLHLVKCAIRERLMVGGSSIATTILRGTKEEKSREFPVLRFERAPNILKAGLGTSVQLVVGAYSWWIQVRAGDVVMLSVGESRWAKYFRSMSGWQMWTGTAKCMILSVSVVEKGVRRDCSESLLGWRGLVVLNLLPEIDCYGERREGWDAVVAANRAHRNR